MLAPSSEATRCCTPSITTRRSSVLAAYAVSPSGGVIVRTVRPVIVSSTAIAEADWAADGP